MTHFNHMRKLLLLAFILCAASLPAATVTGPIINSWGGRARVTGIQFIPLNTPYSPDGGVTLIYGDPVLTNVVAGAFNAQFTGCGFYSVVLQPPSPTYVPPWTVFVPCTTSNYTLAQCTQLATNLSPVGTNIPTFYLVAGSNIVLSAANGTTTISSTGGGGGGTPALAGTNVVIYSVGGSNQFNVPANSFDAVGAAAAVQTALNLTNTLNLTTTTNLVIASTNGLGSAAFTSSGAYDLINSAKNATNGLGALAFLSNADSNHITGQINVGQVYGAVGGNANTNVAQTWTASQQLTNTANSFAGIGFGLTNLNGAAVVNSSNTMQLATNAPGAGYALEATDTTGTNRAWQAVLPVSLVPTNAQFFNGNTIGITNSLLSVGTNGFGGGGGAGGNALTNNSYQQVFSGPNTITNAGNILGGNGGTITNLQSTNLVGVISGSFIGPVYLTNNLTISNAPATTGITLGTNGSLNINSALQSPMMVVGSTNTTMTGISILNTNFPLQAGSALLLGSTLTGQTNYFLYLYQGNGGANTTIWPGKSNNTNLCGLYELGNFTNWISGAPSPQILMAFDVEQTNAAIGWTVGNAGTATNLMLSAQGLALIVGTNSGNADGLTNSRGSTIAGILPQSLVSSNQAAAIAALSVAGGTANTVQTNTSGVAKATNFTAGSSIVSPGIVVGAAILTNIGPFYMIGDSTDASSGEVLAMDISNGRLLAGQVSTLGVFSTNEIIDDGSGNMLIKGRFTNTSYVNFAGPVTNYGNEIILGTLTNSGSVNLAGNNTNWGNFLVQGSIAGNGITITNLSATNLVGTMSGSFAGMLWLTNGWSDTNVLTGYGGNFTNGNLSFNGAYSQSNNATQPFIIQGSNDGDFEFVFQNRASTTNAATSIILTADNGSAAVVGSNNVQLGINGSHYLQTATYFGYTNDWYLFGVSTPTGATNPIPGIGNGWIGTYSTNTSIFFSVANKGSNVQCGINSNGYFGQLGFGTNALGTNMNAVAATNGPWWDISGLALAATNSMAMPRNTNLVWNLTNVANLVVVNHAVQAILPANAAVNYVTSTNWFTPYTSGTNIQGLETTASVRPVISNFWITASSLTFYAGGTSTSGTNITAMVFTNHVACAAVNNTMTVPNVTSLPISTNIGFTAVYCAGVTNLSYCISNSGAISSTYGLRLELEEKWQ